MNKHIQMHPLRASRWGKYLLTVLTLDGEEDNRLCISPSAVPAEHQEGLAMLVNFQLPEGWQASHAVATLTAEGEVELLVRASAPGSLPGTRMTESYASTTSEPAAVAAVSWLLGQLPE